MSPETRSLLKRLAITAAAEALPEGDALSSAMAHARGALMGVVVTGITFGALLLTGCMGLYVWRMESGDSPLNALLWCVATLSGLTLLSALSVKYSLSRFRRVKEGLKFFPRRRNGRDLAGRFPFAGSVIAPAAAAFIEGFIGDSFSHRSSSASARFSEGASREARPASCYAEENASLH
ncbi:MAG: hypothetical protein ABW189_08470 [Rickettsiales bacterium]